MRNRNIPLTIRQVALLMVAQLAVVGVFVNSSSSNLFSAHAQAPTVISGQNSKKIFFDAKSTGFTRDASKQFFRGEVVAIGAGIIITADEIMLDNKEQKLSADGHVILITRSQVFTGDSVIFHLSNGDLSMSHATMLSNDAAEARRISREILGFTEQELEFEQARASRAKLLSNQKQALRDHYREVASQGTKPADDLVDQYSLLLEQEKLLQEQPNTVFASMSKARRDLYQSRRNYWQQGRPMGASASVDARTTVYFRLQGKELTRTDGNDYRAEDAVWSPCACERDESPAWGFRARQIHAQMGGYVDLKHPVLEIKGIPILYLPFLKLPVKSERQSGFVMPVFVQESRSGSIYSQPVYFALDNDKDATFTIDLYQHRGTKGAVEYRYQNRKYSGWTLQLESIRDRLWLDDLNIRKEIQEAQYQDCSQIEEVEDRNICETQQSNLAKQLSTPANTWRGAQIWRGLQILSDRTSLVSHGEIYSDHRYIEELILPDAFKDAFEIGHRATYFTTAKAKINYDGREWYLGLSSKYGDNFTLEDHFAGYQLPLSVVVQSRLFSILPNDLSVPLYGSARADLIQIDASRSTIFDSYQGEVPSGINLGSGVWKRGILEFMSPLVSDGAAKIDFFTNVEGRHISHDGLSKETSHMLSARSGLTLNLPLDGELVIPKWLRTKGDDENLDARYLHHLMDWSLTFSSRPFVMREGLYGQDYQADVNGDGEQTAQVGQTYFASDRDFYDVNTTDAVANEDLMRRHRRLIFSTSHRWRSFSRGFKIKPATPKADAQETKQKETLLEQARRELLYSMDQPVTDLDSLFTDTENGPVWHVDRYALQSYDAKDHLNLTASMSYDFLLAEKRKEQEALGVDEAALEQPWSNPIVSGGFSAGRTYFSGSAIYDLYDSKWLSADFGLSLPSFYSTGVGLVYEIDNRPENQADGSSVYRRTTERSIRLGTAYIPNWKLDLDLRDRRIEEGDPTYQSRFNVRYNSPSRCWQLDFVRTKAFGLEENQAKYLLQLTVLFMGQSRQLPPMHQSIMKKVLPDHQDY